MEGAQLTGNEEHAVADFFRAQTALAERGVRIAERILLGDWLPIRVFGRTAIRFGSHDEAVKFLDRPIVLQEPGR